MSKLDIDFDDGMESQVYVYERLLEFHEDMVATIKNNLAVIWDELRRRRIDAFWQQHEGLRLAVGDKLLVTEEYVQWYEQETRQHSRVASGEDYTITDFDIHELGVQINTKLLHLGVMPLDVARRMREAYLREHGEAQP